MTRHMAEVLVFSAMLALAGLSACQRTSIAGDFQRPLEEQRLVLPGSSHVFILSGQRRLTVDIALDYESDDQEALTLLVGSHTGSPKTGRPVRGAGMRQAVCGVALSPSHTLDVIVQNKVLTRSVPFALRVEPAPSPICTPYTEVPSMLLVQNERRDRAQR